MNLERILLTVDEEQVCPSVLLLPSEVGDDPVDVLSSGHDDVDGFKVGLRRSILIQ